MDSIFYCELFFFLQNNTRELGNSVTRALKEFGIFEEFNNSDNVTEYINEISIDIHHQIIKALISVTKKLN